jgi:hypothetical protein
MRLFYMVLDICKEAGLQIESKCDMILSRYGLPDVLFCWLEVSFSNSPLDRFRSGCGISARKLGKQLRPRARYDIVAPFFGTG